jgi:hypothetical protein
MIAVIIALSPGFVVSSRSLLPRRSVRPRLMRSTSMQAASEVTHVKLVGRTR